MKMAGITSPTTAGSAETTVAARVASRTLRDNILVVIDSKDDGCTFRWWLNYCFFYERHKGVLKAGLPFERHVVDRVREPRMTRSIAEHE